MAELASLVIKVDSSGAVTGVRNLQNLEKQGRKTESAVGSMGSTIKGALAQIGAAVSVAATIKKLVDISREFDVINASLITATGSAESAKVAFGAIQEFASQTPYDLQEVSKAFVQLVNYGLDPSERALTSYGNTSAAMGKSLNQMIEAVADATTFEFERLKEFGIKARQEGDNVSFTFRGVTTTVKKNAAEIENYLIGLGENEFAGAMEERAKTLDGALSNLGDTWDNLFLTISQQGTGSLIYESVMLAEQGLQSLIDLIASGQLEGYLKAYGSQFSAWGGDVAQTLDLVNGLFREFSADVGLGGQDLTSFLTDAFSNMPANIRAFIQIMTVELLAFIDKAGVYGKELMDRLTFWDDTYDHEAELQVVNEVRQASIEGILQERDAAVKSFEDQAKAARSLREEYERQKALREQANAGGVLGRFRIKPKGGDSSDEALSDKEKNSRLKALRLDLDEELAMIQLANTDKLALEQAAHQARMEFIQQAREGRLLSEQEANVAMLEEAVRYQEAYTKILDQEARNRKQIEEKEQRERQKRLQETQRMLGNFATLMNSHSRSLFEIGKVAAISNALLSAKESVVDAYKWGTKIGGPALGSVFAAAAATATAVQVQQIKSQQFGGGSTVSASGGTPGTYQPPQPTQPYGPQERNQGQAVQVIFNGPVNGIDAQHITDTIKDAVNNSDFILIETTSRNGQMLAGR